MDWIIFGLVVVWLGIVSWFDIRKGEIPHSAWVVIPMIAASGYQAWHGGWALVLLTAVVVAVSEREKISDLLLIEEIRRIVTWFPIIFLSLFLAVQLSPVAALAIIGFWMAWELKWWGGADATAGIALILIFPEITFILAFLSVHVLVVVGFSVGSLIKNDSIKLHIIPGLPLLFLAVFLFQFAQYFSKPLT
jgi:hypothetical protein